jgi:hypothetical protein
MEQAHRARARNREKARANATPGTKTVHPRVRIAKDKAVGLAKGLAAVRAKAEERDRDAVGNLKLAAVVGRLHNAAAPKGWPTCHPLISLFLWNKDRKQPNGRPRPAALRLQDNSARCLWSFGSDFQWLVV